MKEIEVKARVTDFANLLKRLEILGCVLSPVTQQTDRIFLSEHGSIPAKRGENVLRIREQDGTYLFTLKQPQTNQLDCIEEEMEITDLEALIRIIKTLKFRESVGVKKKRRTTKYKDYTICLDEVEGLGSFIEVEKFSDEDAASVQKELFTFLETFGITKADQELNGYDVILYQMGKRV